MSSQKKRSYVMDDDILGLILCELPIKQLLRLERVSEQFRDCVNYALQKKTGIRLGKKFQNLRCWDKCHSIVGGNIRRSVKCRYNKYDLTYELDKSLDSFELILKKCPNIKALYLSECRINKEVLQVVVNNCKQLKCLTLAAVFCTKDMKEWKRLTAVIAKLNITHISIVGECYEYNTQRNCSQTQYISPQINYLVIQLPQLERFMAYSYDDPLDNLINSLPPTLKTLDLIRCTKISVASLSLLNSGNFPYLKNLKIDLNFYGRTQESGIFSFICQNLNLNNLVFYGDNEVETFDDINYTSISRLKLKIYERCYSDYKLTEQFMSLRSLYLVNVMLSPENIYLHKSFPELRDLTIKNHQFRCVCVDDCSDGESAMIFGEYRMGYDCFACIPKCIKALSKLSNLKRLRMFNSGVNEAKAFKHFLHLPILELPGFSTYMYSDLINQLAFACLKICDSRKNNPFAYPLTVRGDHSFIKKLDQAILKLTMNDLRWSAPPSNLVLHVREYRKGHFNDY